MVEQQHMEAWLSNSTWASQAHCATGPSTIHKKTWEMGLASQAAMGRYPAAHPEHEAQTGASPTAQDADSSSSLDLDAERTCLPPGLLDSLSHDQDEQGAVTIEATLIGTFVNSITAHPHPTALPLPQAGDSGPTPCTPAANARVTQQRRCSERQRVLQQTPPATRLVGRSLCRPRSGLVRPR